MQFEQGYIYHIYNQGNNRQKIFFNRENYLFFIKKMETYILPYGDILAYCLMPNHFHLMVMVNKISIGVARRNTVGVAQSDADGIRTRTINDSIGIMLRSYTSAINKQENRSGKLFREATKAECINCPKGITPTFVNANGVTRFSSLQAKNQYPQVCFNYIHNNPVKANIVKNKIDWEFSSAQDYAGLKNGKLVSIEVAKQYIDF